MGAFLLFLGGLFVGIVAWLKRVAGETARLDALEAKAKEAAASVDAQQAVAVEAEAHAEKTHAEVEQRLADLDKRLVEERARDTVDVANDIIGGK
jgi:hypothetical protein